MSLLRPVHTPVRQEPGSLCQLVVRGLRLPLAELNILPKNGVFNRPADAGRVSPGGRVLASRAASPIPRPLPSPASNEQRRSQEREGENNKKCRGLGKRKAFPQPPAPRHFAHAQSKWRRPNLGRLPQNRNAPVNECVSLAAGKRPASALLLAAFCE